MERSPVLVAPGVRTASAHAVRSRLSAAFATVLGDPTLWLLGALGFFARGGVVLLALPIITVPTPVTLSIVFRSVITTSGTDAAFAALTFTVLVAFGSCLLAGLLLAAYADVAAFERLAVDPETEEIRAGRVPRRFTTRDRRRLVVWLSGIQAFALVPAGFALAAVADRVDRVIRTEIQFPSDLAVPLFARVVAGTRDQLVLLLIGILLAEVVASLASRRILAASAGVLPEDGRRSLGPLGVVVDGAGRIIRRPVRTLGTALLGWVTTLIVVVPVAWALLAAWSGVRGLYLSPVARGEPEAIAGAVIVTLVLIGIWIVSVVLAGFASALRAAYWSLDALV
jgi:hypothetical protein